MKRKNDNDEYSARKNNRILAIYVALTTGQCVNVAQLANEYRVDKCTIQRDISDIRAFLADQMVYTGEYFLVEYDRVKKSYLMKVG